MWVVNVIHACWVAAGIVGFLEAVSRLRRFRWLSPLAIWTWDILDSAIVFLALGAWEWAIDGLSVTILPITAMVLMDLHRLAERKRGPATAVTLVTLAGCVSLCAAWPGAAWTTKIAMCAPLALAVVLRALKAFPLRAAPLVWALPVMGVFLPRLRMSLFDLVSAVVTTLLFAAYCYERRNRERVWRESTLDPLTRCLNRRGADLWMHKHAGKRVVAVIIDLDDFKFVNDTYGHDAGDRFLQETARRLQASVCPEDAVIRWGGDEFLLLLPCSESEEPVKRRVHDIHHRLTGFPADLGRGGQPLYLRASVGVAAGPLNKALIQRADQALLRTKRSSKNAVTVWQEETSEGPWVADDVTRELRFSAAFLSALAQVAEWGIPGLADHVARVQAYVRWLARLASARGLLPEEEVEPIAMASVAHDIGKAAIAREILLKPDRLHSAEYAYVRGHTESGRDMLERVIQQWQLAQDPSARRLFAHALDIAWCHHERWDGTGYPRGLAGADIPLAARLTAIADVLDALLSRRPYKDPWPEQQVFHYFREQRGRQFDPNLVDLLLEHWHGRPFVETRDAVEAGIGSAD
ncbi:diguanylate cyclase domain-containing protein [Alicyclobacillus macrosporangiidus]|uniref:bifunctional diguanylate cyclase/phosphohydrolase n=1 Tax=Alicyclobacillus macrosporangiidus TaxID=392015 RepID=UPI0006903675|nr:diguanylate cyclase [Alicyclobacillus macrosporangiidus]